MEYTSLEIANMLNGKVEGDQKMIIDSVSSIQDGKKGDLCFLSNPKYNNLLYSTKASIVIINEKLELEKDIKCTLIRVKDPYLAFSHLLDRINKYEYKHSGLSKNAHISDSAEISKDCYVGPFVFIGENVVIEKNVKIYPHCYIGDNVTIKDNSILFSGVKIYKDSIIGKNNILHSGVIIGADGFGFTPHNKGEYKKIQQIGNVITQDLVEIGANTTIDRATLGSTIIEEGVKLDNQIQIGHNVIVGKNTVIAGLVGIAGSTKIGRNCMIGGSTGIAGHLNIGNNVKIAGHTGVGSNIKDNKTIQGPYAFDQKDFLRSYIIFKKLPKIYNDIEKIKKEML